MPSTKPQTYIISLGGSLIVPNETIDWRYLKQFRSLILRHVGQGSRFCIITGGGWTCRHYQQSASKVVTLTDYDLDALGIQTTRLNAYFLRTLFGNAAYPGIITNPNKKITTDLPIMIAGGWEPGRSTDDDAVRLAKTYGITHVINLSNIDYAYTKDPRKFKDAKKITHISWADFRRIVGSRWSPGMSAPFDPIASKLAQKLNLTVAIMNGKALKNVERCLAGQPFKGTEISPS